MSTVSIIVPIYKVEDYIREYIDYNLDLFLLILRIER